MPVVSPRTLQSLFSVVKVLPRIVESRAQVFKSKRLRLYSFFLQKSSSSRGIPEKFFRYPLLAAFGGFSLKAMATDSSKVDLHRKADELFDGSKFEDLIRLLKEQEGWSDDSELLWRVARCNFQLSKKETDSKKKNELVKGAYDNVVRSLELNSECGFAHKWAAILLDQASAIDGSKARIEQTLNVQKHMEEAIRLLPTDGTSYYLLGEWHYSVYNISWIEKKVASVIFATLPEGSLETALEMFEKAEQVEPGFYSKNLVLLAKTLMGLKRDPEKAKKSLLSVVEQYSQSEKWDDKEAVKEAKELLHKLGVKV